MKIVFLSNFYNHHQSGISCKLYEETQGQYRFVATEAMPEERKRLGYADITDEFVLQYGENSATDAEIQQMIDGADVVIIGSAPEHLIENRKKSRKLIMRYSERPLKKGFQLWKYPLRYFTWHRNNPRRVPIYMLCSSAYTASDYAKFGLFKNRALKWGYFPQCIKYEYPEQLIAEKNISEILWCGRFLDWKHPDDVIKAAKKLRDDGYSFTLDFIGTGEMEEDLKNMVREYSLDERVSFLGSMKPSEVRSHMEKAGIYVFTSDKQEGWGAVLNESMNSGCAVVASHAIGSVPYLVEDNKNGLIYRSGDVEMLYKKIKYLLDNPNEQERLGRAAYETIINEWNAKVAAERFIKLSKKILSGEKYPELYTTGPCSKAEIMKDDYL